MIKRLFDQETYRKIGSPDLKAIIFFKKDGIKRYGKVVLVNYFGHKGKIQVGIEPFNTQPTTNKKNMKKTIEQLIEERIITEKDGYSEGRVSLNVIAEIAKTYSNQKLDEAYDLMPSTKLDRTDHYDYSKGVDRYIFTERDEILELKDPIP